METVRVIKDASDDHDVKGGGSTSTFHYGGWERVLYDIIRR